MQNSFRYGCPGTSFFTTLGDTIFYDPALIGCTRILANLSSFSSSLEPIRTPLDGKNATTVKKAVQYSGLVRYYLNKRAGCRPLSILPVHHAGGYMPLSRPWRFCGTTRKNITHNMTYLSAGGITYAMRENNFHAINISMPYLKNIVIVGFGHIVSIIR